MSKKKFALAIHGGAGTILKSMLTDELENKYHQALKEALKPAIQILENGGDAVCAVEKAVMALEDCPLFNAGKGAVFSSEGAHEMEASIMCGKAREAGAIAEVKNIKNPISLAKKVLEDHSVVYLCGEGAEKYGQQFPDLKKVDQDYYFTQERYDQWQAVKDEDHAVLDHDGDHLHQKAAEITNKEAKGGDYKFGTVGAVALDQHGNIAAATSTGGLTNKKFGRLGDSSLIGCGTYANNDTCAVSCTGYGEYFIKEVVANNVSAIMEYGGKSLKESCDHIVHKRLVEVGGEGGLIAIDKDGNIELSYNSEGMYRGYYHSDEGDVKTFIF